MALAVLPRPGPPMSRQRRRTASDSDVEIAARHLERKDQCLLRLVDLRVGHLREYVPGPLERGHQRAPGYVRGNACISARMWRGESS